MHVDTLNNEHKPRCAHVQIIAQISQNPEKLGGKLHVAYILWFKTKNVNKPCACAERT